ncbi:hypothetical protein [Halostagnicola bangensis]
MSPSATNATDHPTTDDENTFFRSAHALISANWLLGFPNRMRERFPEVISR